MNNPPWAITSYSAIDWQLITLQAARGLGSNAKLAKAIGISESLVHNMTSGRACEPRFTVAMRLLDLWADLVN